MRIIQVPCWEDNYSYILHLNRQVLVIDPCDPKNVLEVLKDLEFDALSVLNTHHHPDHIHGNKTVVKHFEELWQKPIAVYCSERDKNRVPLANHFLPLEDEKLVIGDFEFLKFHTPGHSEGHLVLFHEPTLALFCADVLFTLGCGKLLEGNAEELFASHNKLLQLPPETLVYSAHEYTMSNFTFTEWVHGHPLPILKKKFEDQLAEKSSTVPSTLQFEIENNLFLSCRNPQVQEALKARMGLKSEISALGLFKILRATRNLGPKPTHFVI